MLPIIMIHASWSSILASIIVCVWFLTILNRKHKHEVVDNKEAWAMTGAVVSAIVSQYGIASTEPMLISLGIMAWALGYGLVFLIFDVIQGIYVKRGAE